MHFAFCLFHTIVSPFFSSILYSLMKPFDHQIDASSECSTEGKNIKVYLRIRSISTAEVEKGAREILDVYPPQSVAIQDPHQTPRPYARESEDAFSNHELTLAEPQLHNEPLSRAEKVFSFDGIFEQSATQRDVFTEVGVPIVQSAVEGYNTCILAYGQTGSGKTYSMVGKEETLRPYVRSLHENQRLTRQTRFASQDATLLGIMPRACSMLFETLEALKHAEVNPVCSYTVELTCVEIYKEVVKCLLNEQADCVIRDHPLKGPVAHGATMCQVDSAESATELLNQAFRRRTCAPTNQNKVSSRSHAICTFTISVSRLKATSSEQYTTTGTMHLVDLAGSERIHLAKTDNERVKEAGLIGCSLLALGKVIKALIDDNLHVPYRDSQLTRLLKNALGGNSRTAMLTTVSPSSANYTDTLHALFYADRVKSIRNQPHINQTRAQIDMHAMQLELKRMHSENLALQREKGHISCPKDCDAILMRSASMFAPGKSVGVFLKRGFVTGMNDGGNVVEESSRSSMDSGRATGDEENEKQPLVDWSGDALVLRVPAGWNADRRVPCCGLHSAVSGPCKIPIFHQDTIQFTIESAEGSDEQGNTGTFVLIGGPEDHAHVCGLHSIDQSPVNSEIQQSVPNDPITPIPPLSLENALREGSAANHTEHTASEHDECFAVESSPETEAPESLSILRDAIQALFDAAELQPESDLPAVVDIPENEVEASPRAGGPHSPITGSSTKRLVSARRRRAGLSKIHLESGGSIYSLAFDASKQQVCAIIEERPQQEALFQEGRTSADSTDSAESPQRRSLGEITAARARTIVYDLEKLFPYVVQYVNLVLAHRAKQRESAFAEIVDQANKMQGNYQQQLQLKTQRESELTTAMQNAAAELTRVKRANEDVAIQLTSAKREVSALQEEMSGKDDHIRMYETENAKLSKRIDAMKSTERALADERAKSEQLRVQLSRSQDEANALHSQVKILGDEMRANISIASRSVRELPETRLPQDIDPACGGCVQLTARAENLRTQLHFSEANRQAMEESLSKRATANVEMPQTIRSLKAEVRESLHAVDHLKKEYEAQTAECARQTEENADLLLRIRTLLTEQTRREAEIKTLEAKLNEQIARTNDAVHSAVHDERVRSAAAEEARQSAAQKHLETEQMKQNTDFIKKVDMIDEKRINVQKLAHELEKKSRIPLRGPDPMRIPQKPYTPQRLETNGQPMGNMAVSRPIANRQVERRSTRLATSDPSMQTSFASGTDIDRHIMRIKEKVDRKFANQSNDGFRLDATAFIDREREERLNAKLQENASLHLGPYLPHDEEMFE